MVEPSHPVAARAWQRLEELGKISDHPGQLARVFLSPANLAAARTTLGWMDQAGWKTSHDALGNVRGIHPSGRPDARPVLLGSHLDTVIDAGKYDGALGIVVAIAAMEWLAAENLTPSFPVHVLGFCDEEGVRFHATYLGSRACTGRLDDRTLDLRDASGRNLRQIIAEEGWHEGASSIVYEPGEAAAYVEVHIEQGRMLEETGHALGVVPSICGQSRIAVTMTGKAEHAGTTPMYLRRDALAAAAACVLAIESYARERAPLVATVGRLGVLPGAGNVVPGRVEFTLDIRHPGDAARASAVEELQAACRRAAEDRSIHMNWNVLQSSAAVTCGNQVTRLLAEAIRQSGRAAPIYIPSGAGHDAVMMSEVAPVGMLFVRCRDGLSHHPEESVTPEDVAAAIGATAAFLRLWEKEAGNG
jgi:allantoate deiminase